MSTANVWDVVNALQNEPSTNNRLAILEYSRDDKDVLAFFKACLDDRKYGVKQIPEHSLGDGVEMSAMLSLLDQLASRQLTGNKAKEAVKDMLDHCTSNDAEVFTRMLTKFPNCGVEAILCRKVWPEHFEKKVLLCKAMPFSAKNMEEIQWPAISQTKMDGARCLAFVEDGKAVFLSSSGKEFLGLDALGKDVSDAISDGWIVDGELLVAGSDGKIMSRKEGNGILNKSLHGTISEKEADRVRFVVWDIVTAVEYDRGRGSIPYWKTLQMMQKIFSSCRMVSVVESREVASRDEAFIHFQQMLNRGEEGTILKNREMVWEGKRSKNCVKFKIIIENTLKVVDMVEGTGKYRGMLGCAICETSDGLLKVGVGSGFSDDERHALWDAREDLMEHGLFLEVKSNGLIATESREWSLFLPRCSEVRLDKTEADDFSTVEALSTGAEMLSSVRKA